MKAIMFAEATHTYKAPQGMEDEVFDLPVYDNGQSLTSIWVPSEEDLDILVNGGAISLSILGRSLPPVAVGVVPLAEPDTPI